MQLPDLPFEYSNSIICDVKIGPRREITLSLRIVEWFPQNGRFSLPETMRFGGIFNFDEAKEFFAQQANLELAFLRYSTAHNSKFEDLFIELQAERIDCKFVIHCKNVTIS